MNSQTNEDISVNARGNWMGGWMKETLDTGNNVLCWNGLVNQLWREISNMTIQKLLEWCSSESALNIATFYYHVNLKRNILYTF